MSLEIAALVWKETRQFMHDTGDVKEAANHVVEALMVLMFLFEDYKTIKRYFFPFLIDF